VLPFVLASPTLELLVPSAADVPAIVEACRDETLRRFTTVPVPYDRSDAEFFLSRIVDDGWATGREFTWGLRRPGSGLLEGVISVRLRSSDVGFWTAPASRGQGLMTDALGLVADWAFEGGGLRELFWEGYVGNDASAAVARHVGFTYQGVGPGLHPGRDGGHPLCWKARLRPGDERSTRPGWPALVGPAAEADRPAEYRGTGGVDSVTGAVEGARRPSPSPHALARDRSLPEAP
jgi:RimJ/RimL family protein N-acetyltransferase